MKVLLAGASGLLGRKITRELRAAGHEVAGLGRGEGSTVRADLLDREAVLRAVGALAYDVAEGRIHHLRFQVNPEKLRGLA
ncbi:NAD-dependent epimerase/dehydratase family protein [Kitasatospora sp. NPDC056181]|uniref:NAD-dependent epimerase/dehydratase family protein n=1 Tax=Kitasatospora sp. NPDC056181 TaxID=3345737 RepID=UPI0035D8ED1E